MAPAKGDLPPPGGPKDEQVLALPEPMVAGDRGHAPRLGEHRHCVEVEAVEGLGPGGRRASARWRSMRRRVNGMAMVDDMAAAVGAVAATARQGLQMRAAREDVDPIVVDAHLQQVADEARRDGVESPAQHAAA